MASNDFDVIIIQGTQYLVPKANANPPYGEELNDYLKALGNAYSTLVGVGDLQETAATIANNIAVATAVDGLSFDSATVRSANIAYQVTRSTSTTTEIEAGTILLFYNSTLPSTQKWTLIRDAGGACGVDFTINDAGQVLYTSTNLGGTGYAGLIKYEARSLLQS